MESFQNKEKAQVEGSLFVSCFIRVSEASRLTGIPVGTLRQLCVRRAVPFYRRGRSVVFDRDELIAYIKSGRVA